jgi:hypothetical protein
MLTYQYGWLIFVGISRQNAGRESRQDMAASRQEGH